MLVQRALQPHLLRLAAQYPVVTVTGPRQSGKTTLCRMCFPDHAYASLENPDTRQFAVDDPKGFLATHRTPLIIDEVQRVPDLLSYIQGQVDERRTPGEYVLTGSSQLEPLAAVSQSLAGRTALLKLLPFSYGEAYPNEALGLDETLLRGFYPGVHDRKLDPVEAYSFYIETYLERDVLQLLRVKDRSAFEQLLRLAAGHTGRILNMSSLSMETGVTVPTIKSWLSVLEASFVIAFLRPHHANFRKRLIRSPKLYFLDTGIACRLLGIRSSTELATHPLRGAIFETYVFGELLKLQYNRVREGGLFYFRDNSGHEVDVISDDGARVRPIEIKSGATLRAEIFRGLDYYRTLNPASDRGLLVYGGEGNQKRSDHDVLDFRSIASLSQERG